MEMRITGHGYNKGPLICVVSFTTPEQGHRPLATARATRRRLRRRQKTKPCRRNRRLAQRESKPQSFGLVVVVAALDLAAADSAEARRGISRDLALEGGFAGAAQPAVRGAQRPGPPE